MALYSKKEFAELLGIKTKHLSMYISRKQVVVKGNMVDDNDQINALFMQKRAVVTAKSGEADVENRPKPT
jgi:predicted transcriptional regulator